MAALARDEGLYVLNSAAIRAVLLSSALYD